MTQHKTISGNQGDLYWEMPNKCLLRRSTGGSPLGYCKSAMADRGILYTQVHSSVHPYLTNRYLHKTPKQGLNFGHRTNGNRFRGSPRTSDHCTRTKATTT